MFAIVISEKGGAERREAFDRPEISVGRVQGNDLMLPKGNVSKRHARLMFRDARFIVTDLNSTNGTYVNRRRISQATIVREGDRIYIGDFVLRIEPTGTGSVPVPEDSNRVSSDSGTVSRESLESPPRDGDTGHHSAIPEVPAPPRVPSGATSPRVRNLSDAASEESVGVPHRVAAPEPSRPSIPSPRRPVASIPDPDALSYRSMLGILVERVESALEPGELDEDLVGLSSRVSQLLTEHLNRLQLEGRMAADLDSDQLLTDARVELLGSGPLEALLIDSTVTGVVVSRFDDVVVSRGGDELRVEPPFTSEVALQRAIRRLCERSGVPVGEGEHVLERRLIGGALLSAAMAPASVRGTVAVLRKLREVRAMLDELVRGGMASASLAAFLEQCVAARVNLLVTGPRDLGTFRVVSALCSAAASAHHVVVQSASEMVPADDATLFSVTGASQETGRLVDLAAHVPRAKLVIELASPELTASLMSAVASGIEGVIGVAYASSQRRALTRIPADLMAARPGLAADAAREWVAASFDIVVELGRLADGRARVLRVCEITGTGGGGVATQEIFAFMIDHAASGSAVQGSFVASGTVPRVVAELQARGLTVDTSLFSRPR